MSFEVMVHYFRISCSLNYAITLVSSNTNRPLCACSERGCLLKDTSASCSYCMIHYCSFDYYYLMSNIYVQLYNTWQSPVGVWLIGIEQVHENQNQNQNQILAKLIETNVKIFALKILWFIRNFSTLFAFNLIASNSMHIVQYVSQVYPFSDFIIGKFRHLCYMRYDSNAGLHSLILSPVQ